MSLLAFLPASDIIFKNVPGVCATAAEQENVNSNPPGLTNDIAIELILTYLKAMKY
jgi:hypothetical protein